MEKSYWKSKCWWSFLMWHSTNLVTNGQLVVFHKTFYFLVVSRHPPWRRYGRLQTTIILILILTKLKNEVNKNSIYLRRVVLFEEIISVILYNWERIICPKYKGFAWTLKLFNTLCFKSDHYYDFLKKLDFWVIIVLFIVIITIT